MAHEQKRGCKWASGWRFLPVMIVLFAAAAEGRAGEAAGAASVPRLQVAVDPRVELLSILFRLAGNPEYNQGRVDSYTADVEKQFGGFREHRAVGMAREIRRSRGVSFDACMSLAAHLTDAYEVKLMVPLDPWPETLDRRWTAENVKRFLAEVRVFVQDTSFRDFVAQHRALYQTAETRLRALVEREAHAEWFPEFFGERARAAFTVTPALLNGGSCYGIRSRDAEAGEEVFCILGVWRTDAQGLPEFTSEMLATIIHEFCHSYANAIVDRHWKELSGAGSALYRHVAARMRAQAYGSAQTMMYESLVRACTVRYLQRYGGAEAGRRAIEYEIGRGFLWMPELSGLLGEYEAQRDRYPTLGAFAPRLAAFFTDYAPRFAKEQAALAAGRPKVVSTTPADGATGVDPGLGAIRVVFDRPMRDGSWAFAGEPSRVPQTSGKPYYDAARTTWTVPVKLEPDRAYRFGLNSDRHEGFRSAEGVPLEPVSVAFQTGRGGAERR